MAGGWGGTVWDRVGRVGRGSGVAVSLDLWWSSTCGVQVEDVFLNEEAEWLEGEE
jgi:hypothetical protein